MKQLTILLAVLALVLAACSVSPATEVASPASIGENQTPVLPLTGTEEPANQAQPESTGTPEDALATLPAGSTASAATDPAGQATPTTASAETGGASASSAVLYRIVPEESSVQYEVGETFIDQNNRFSTAIGVSQGVSGEIEVDRENPQNSKLGTITVEISQFKSDSGRRDNAIRERFLQSARFPQAVFEPTSIEGLPAAAQEGADIPIRVTGNLTVREVTRPVTFDVTVRLDGDIITGQAVTTILMSDFGFGPISIAGILNTEDEVKVTFDFVARPS